MISSSGCSKSQSPITKQEIIQAQKAWGDGLVSIGKAYSDKKDYKNVATKLVNDLYAYQLGEVLFKPSLAYAKPFRLTEKGALSYFIGDDKNFPEDKGFALVPLIKVRFANVGFFIQDNYAVAMGNYFFTPKKGKTIKVEYTFGYIKDKNGKLRIHLQHSSLPYSEK
ncbi:MAG: hypothetical protein K940chlam1_00216 [Candidatus Anoxychlamydiales bacterium]|nr:hypothetical protein [Candidatus Anoxychlamydiales bacterium]NGX35469.1 hypothetical protein [Candidatus Anoxychlamydiales bacterium]